MGPSPLVPVRYYQLHVVGLELHIYWGGWPLCRGKQSLVTQTPLRLWRWGKLPRVIVFCAGRGPLAIDLSSTGTAKVLHVGGRRGLLPGLESATAKISGSGRSGVPPNMSTWCIPSGVARGAAQPEHDMAWPASPHGTLARSQHEDAERRTLAPTQKSSATPGYGGSGGHSGQARGPGGGREAWEALPPQADAPQPWSYCARSGGRAPHNSRQVG